MDRAEVGDERERREVRGVGRRDHGGGEAAREVVVGRRVRTGRVVVRERPGPRSRSYIFRRGFRRAAVAATVWGRAGGGCGGGGVPTAGGARAPEGSRVGQRGGALRCGCGGSGTAEEHPVAASPVV